MSNPEFTTVFQVIDSTREQELKLQLSRKAVNYSVIRSEWYFLNQAERAEGSRNRSAAHDAFIDACNILSRAMNRGKEDNAWRATLGDERKRIGDFACYVACRLGIMMQ